VVEMTTSNPARWVYTDNGIETLRVGACMVVTLMRCPKGRCC
jgi:hypothetical protein